MAKDTEEMTWKEVKHLGAGGFGSVNLWRNTISGEYIAVKRCRVQSEMNEKNKSRWKLECEMMLRLKCRNVVQALDPPKQFKSREALSDSLPVLVMEYCVGGDLRKVLIQPENACGLPEATVRAIACDVSAGLEYLHKNKIIHRDLKPENVVMQIEANKAITYKIIDLGYAKDLEQGSVARSFVGTTHYLAPELYQNTRYTSTVDFWSFGLMMFECITGSRPFFPSLAPARWHYDVSRKSDNHIHAFYGPKNSVEFSEHIPWPHKLTKPFQLYMEQWLRLMLRWEPQYRGRKPGSSGERDHCYTLLDNILSFPILHILHVETNMMYGFPIPENTILNKEINMTIAHLTNIPYDEQLVINENGEVLNPNDPISFLISKLNSADRADGITLFYLFDLRSAQFDKGKLQNIEIPSLMAILIREPESVMVLQDMKKTWAQVVFYCEESKRACDKLLIAANAVVLYLLNIHKMFYAKRHDLIMASSDLRSVIDYYNKSFECDKIYYEEQVTNGVKSEVMCSRWKKQSDLVASFAQQVNEAEKLIPRLNAITASTIELQNHPLIKMPYAHPSISKLDHIANIVLASFKKLRAANSDDIREGTEQFTNASMHAYVKEFVQERDKFYSDFCDLMSVEKCNRKIFEAIGNVQTNMGLDDRIKKLRSSKETVMEQQQARQNNIWMMIKKSVNKVKTMQAEIDEKNRQQQMQSSHKGVTTPVNTSPQLNSRLNNANSMFLCEEVNSTIKRLTGLLGETTDQSDDSLYSSMDWSFLNV